MAVFTSMTTGDLLPLDNITDMTSTPTVDPDNVSFVGNQTTQQDEDHIPRLSTTIMAIYFGMRLLFSGFAICGNMLTIVAVIRFRQLQNTTNFLICSLAAADMLGGSMTPLMIVHQMLSDQPIFVPLCLIEKTICLISAGTSLISIMWIAIDRYIYIAYPFRYPLWVTRTKTFILIGLTWLFAVTQTTSLFILSHHLKIGMKCTLVVFLSSFAFYKIIIPQLALFAGITAMFYMAISRIAYKQGKAIAALNQPYNTYEATMNRQQKKIAKMMVMVLGTYFICYCPLLITRFTHNSSSTILWLRIEKITVLIYWANTWLNPLIYAWKSEDFRVAFRKLLGMRTPVVTPNI